LRDNTRDECCMQTSNFQGLHDTLDNVKLINLRQEERDSLSA